MMQNLKRNKMYVYIILTIVFVGLVFVVMKTWDLEYLKSNCQKIERSIVHYSTTEIENIFENYPTKTHTLSSEDNILITHFYTTILFRNFSPQCIMRVFKDTGEIESVFYMED